MSAAAISRLSVGEEEALEHACRIWFCAPEGRVGRELSELPRAEREQVWADLTGNKEISTFEEVPKEDPEQIERCLRGLLRELLDFAPTNPSKALSTAVMTSPDYVCNPQFMLRFLRAQKLSVSSTVALMVRHFEMKRELFGGDKIGRDIVLSDLNQEDIHVLANGVYRYLAGTDRAGRFITFLDFTKTTFVDNNEKKSLLRSVFYWNMAAAENENSQRLGIVRIAYFHQSYPRGGPDNEFIRVVTSIIDTVPIRTSAVYLVAGSSLWAKSFELILFVLSPFVRVRTRVVSGSYYEKIYALMCLGIPSNAIPVLEDGNLKNEDVVRFIAKRRALEEQING